MKVSTKWDLFQILGGCSISFLGVLILYNSLTNGDLVALVFTEKTAMPTGLTAITIILGIMLWLMKGMYTKKSKT